MALTITPYAGQGWTNESAPDLSAETLTDVDSGITSNSNAINAIANAVVDQITNDPDKIASIRALFAYKQATDLAISDLNSDLVNLSNKFQLTSGVLKFTVGYKTNTNEPYFIIYVGNDLYYQLTLKATTILFEKRENGVYTTIWEK